MFTVIQLTTYCFKRASKSTQNKSRFFVLWIASDNKLLNLLSIILVTNDWVRENVHLTNIRIKTWHCGWESLISMYAEDPLFNITWAKNSYTAQDLNLWPFSIQYDFQLKIIYIFFMVSAPYLTLPSTLGFRTTPSSTSSGFFCSFLAVWMGCRTISKGLILDVSRTSDGLAENIQIPMKISKQP